MPKHSKQRPEYIDGQPDAIASRLVPDELWQTIEPLLPQAKARPQGGGARRNDDRPLLVAVVYVVTTGTAWRKLPSWCGTTHASTYRRFAEWTTEVISPTIGV